MVIWIAILIGRILLMAFSSDKAVEHSVILAAALGISSLIIGLVLVSLGSADEGFINCLREKSSIS